MLQHFKRGNAIKILMFNFYPGLPTCGAPVGDTPSIDSTPLYKLRISLDLQLIHKVDLVGAKAPSSFIYLILNPVGSCMLKLLNGERHKLSAKPVVWARMDWKSFFNMVK